MLRLVQRQDLVRDLNGDGRVGAGDVLVFRATVTNQGTAPSRSPSVSDAFLARQGLHMSCSAPSLAVGQSTSCSSGDLVVTVGMARSGSIVNDMTPRGITASGAVIVGPTVSATVTLVVPAVTTAVSRSGNPPAPRQVKRLDLSQYRESYDDVNGNGALTAGETMVIGFEVLNTGTVTLGDLTIVDKRLSDDKVTITCASRSLAPGQRVLCSTSAITITDPQAKVLGTGFGSNFAYATATTATGDSVRSPTTTLHQGYFISDVQGTALPTTGVALGIPVGVGVVLLLLGGLALLLSRGGRVPSARHRRRLSLLRLG